MLCSESLANTALTRPFRTVSEIVII